MEEDIREFKWDDIINTLQQTIPELDNSDESDQPLPDHKPIEDGEYTDGSGENKKFGDETVYFSDYYFDAFYVASLREIEKSDRNDLEKQQMKERLDVVDKWLYTYVNYVRETLLFLKEKSDKGWKRIEGKDRFISDVDAYYKAVYDVIKEQDERRKRQEQGDIEYKTIDKIDEMGKQLLNNHPSEWSSTEEAIECQSEITSALRASKKWRAYKKLRELPQYMSNEFKERHKVYLLAIDTSIIRAHTVYKTKGMGGVWGTIKDSDDMAALTEDTFNAVQKGTENAIKTAASRSIIFDKRSFDEVNNGFKNRLPDITSKPFQCIAVLDIKWSDGTEYIAYAVSGNFDYDKNNTDWIEMTNLLNGLFSQYSITERARLTDRVKYYSMPPDDRYFCNYQKARKYIGSVGTNLSNSTEKMFSCCERKLIAYFERSYRKKVVDIHTLYSRYKECAACERSKTRIEDNKGGIVKSWKPVIGDPGISAGCSPENDIRYSTYEKAIRHRP